MYFPIVDKRNREIAFGGDTLTDKELIGKVHSAVYHQCQQRGYAAPVDVLIDVGVLPKQKYEDWRYGKVSYLEQVCTCNLRKLSFIMSQIRKYVEKSDLKSSFCYYKRVRNEKEKRTKAKTCSSASI